MTAIRTVIRIIIYGFTERSSRRARIVSWNCCGGDGNDVKSQERLIIRGQKHEKGRGFAYYRGSGKK